MSVSSDWDLASDAEIITAVRSGDSAAFGVLYERHAGAARAVARQYSNSAADAEDAVSDAFSRVFSAIQGGGGPDVAFRAYLFTVLRRVALDRIELTRRAQPTDDVATFEEAAGPVGSTEEPTLAGFERGVVSAAYKSLPERWQAVLWYTEVEELTPAQIAPVLGLTANGVAALAYRAREGLRQAYLQQHLASPQSEACTIVNAKLGAYVRGGLAKRETALVEAHLDECGTCRALVLELGDVNHGMRVVVAPLILGGVGVLALKGLGFGGAAGAAAAASGAGAGAGAGAAGAGTAGGGAGAGTGAGAGATAGAAGAGGGGSFAGAGALTGAGVGTAGTGAASGAVAVGVGAAALATPASAQAGTMGTGATSTGATGTGATAGVGATATAGATAGASVGAAASATGVAALVAGLPIGAIGLAVAGVVVAGAVATAGLLGAFSGEPTPEGEQETLAVPEEPDPTTPADETDPDADDEPGTAPEDVEPTVPSDEPSSDPTDPANVPSSLQDEEPDTETPADPADPPSDPVDPPDEPVDPPDEPVDPGPPVLAFDPLGEVAVQSGAGAGVALSIRNDGDVPAGEVRVHFTFPAGVTGAVVPDETGVGGGQARTAPFSGGWTCGAGSVADVWTCAVPGIPAHSVATLSARLHVTAPAVDGTGLITIGVRTEAVGTTAVVESALRVNVSSPPAVVTVADAGTVDLEGHVGEDTSATLTFPVTNSGGTTAQGLQAQVTLPALPAGLTVSPRADMPWTCVPADATHLSCTLPRLPRPGGLENPSAPVVLDVVAAGARPAEGAGFLHDVFAGPVSVTVAGVPTAGVATLTASPAPADVQASWDPIDRLTGQAPQTLSVTVSNMGGLRSAADVTVTLPTGVAPEDPAAQGWDSCLAQADGTVVCAAGVEALAGSPATLDLTVHSLVPNRSGAGVVTVVVREAGVVRWQDEATLTFRPAPQGTPALSLVAPRAEMVRNGEGAVAFGVQSSGDGTARNVHAEVTLPPQLQVVRKGQQPPAGLDPAWTCSISPDGRTADCLAAALDPGVLLTLDLPVRASGNPPWGDVTLRIWADGVAAQTATVPATEVGAVEGLVTVSGLATSGLVQRDTPLRYAVENTGTAAAGPVSVVVEDAALHGWKYTVNSPAWACRATGPTGWWRVDLTCTTQAVPAGGTTLDLQFRPFSAGTHRLEADWQAPASSSGTTTATVTVKSS